MLRRWIPGIVASALLITLMGEKQCHAMGGTVKYPDGTPVVGASIHIDLDSVERFRVAADFQGRFELPSGAFLEALVQIDAPDGERFAPANLPVALFESGDVAVVLQAR